MLTVKSYQFIYTSTTMKKKLVPWKFGINDTSQFNTDKIESNFCSLLVLSQKLRFQFQVKNSNSCKLHI